MNKIIDISRNLTPSISTWPGSRKFEHKILNSFEQGHHFRESEVAMNIHTGTHMDAPSHFTEEGGSLSSINLSLLIGKAVVIQHDQDRPISKGDLENKSIQGYERVLIKTLNSFKDPTVFDKNFIALESEAAAYLVSLNIKLVGIDGPSVQLFHDKTPETHRVLLKNDVVVIEGLNLSEVSPGEYQLIALPLKIDSAEGSPTRAILIEGNI